MSDKRNILILSAGRRVELVQAFQQALVKYFPEAMVYATDLNPEFSAACQSVQISFKAPRVTATEYIDYLLDLCNQHAIGLVIPTIDTELNVLAKNRLKFESYGINLIISGTELVAACRDKRETAKIFDNLDVSQPVIYKKDNIKFPCFCKPYDGSCSVGAIALESEDYLTRELLDNEKNMFMELVPKDYSEYTVDAYYNRRSQLRCLVPRERLEVRGGEVSKGTTRKNFVYDYLLSRLDRIDDAVGCLTIQVFANNKTHSIKALEINPRFGGGYPLTDASGANYAEWLIREYFLNEEICFFDNWENNLLMLRYDSKVLVHEASN
ncbi:MAG: ATP-grasp domain-containing protein [Saccharospirillum sp.]